MNGVTIHKLTVSDKLDPRYEVESPHGYRWVRPVEGHYFMAWTEKEISSTLRWFARVEPCPADCDCRIDRDC